MDDLLVAGQKKKKKKKVGDTDTEREREKWPWKNKCRGMDDDDVRLMVVGRDLLPGGPRVSSS